MTSYRLPPLLPLLPPPLLLLPPIQPPLVVGKSEPLLPPPLLLLPPIRPPLVGNSQPVFTMAVTSDPPPLDHRTPLLPRRRLHCLRRHRPPTGNVDWNTLLPRRLLPGAPTPPLVLVLL